MQPTERLQKAPHITVSRREALKLGAGGITAAGLALLGCGSDNPKSLTTSVPESDATTKSWVDPRAVITQESFPSEFRPFRSTYFSYETSVPTASKYSHALGRDIFEFRDQEGPASLQIYPVRMGNPNATVNDWAEREISELKRFDQKAAMLSPSDPHFTSFSNDARPVMEIANKALQDIVKIKMGGKDTKVIISFTKVLLEPDRTMPSSILHITAFTVAGGNAWYVKFSAVDNLLVYRWKMSPMEVAMKSFHLLK